MKILNTTHCLPLFFMFIHAQTHDIPCTLSWSEWIKSEYLHE
jgi:hypothetical protein